MQSFCKSASWRVQRIVLQVGVLVAMGLTAMVASAAQPANDNFANAQVIPTWGPNGAILSGSLSNDLTSATAESPLEPNHAGFLPSHTIWYSWTAPQDGEVQLDTLSSTNDTVLAVYTGSILSQLRQVAANDDLFPYTQQNISEDVVDFGFFQFLTPFSYVQPFNGPSGLRFNAKAGTMYYFAVGSKFAGGPVILGWAYHSSGVFRFATEDVDFTTGAPVFRMTDLESSGDNESTFHTYYEYSVPGVLVTVTRLGGSSGRVLVDYATEDIADPIPPNGAAAAFLDYFPASGTLVFDDGEMTKRIVIQNSFGFGGASNLDFAVVLTNARPDVAESPDVSIPRIDGGYGRAIVRIYNTGLDPVLASNYQEDTNSPTGSTFTGPTNQVYNFSRKAYRVPEDVNSYWAEVRIPVVRSGTNQAGETIYYRVDNLLGNARDPDEGDNNFFPLQPGSDYATPTPEDDANGGSEIGIHGRNADFTMTGNYTFPGGGSINWGQNDFVTKTINFTVTNDSLTEFNEDFVITLYRIVDNNVRLVGMVNQTTVSILFDDHDAPAGSVDQFYNPDFGASMAPPITTSPPNMAHPGADGAVYGVLVQSDNRTIIAGEFTAYNASPRGRIARLNLDGSLDATFNPGSGANDFIGAIAATPSGQLVIGGGFGSYNGTPRARVARINANGALDNSFNPGLGANGSIWSLAVQPDGKVIVGGDFSTVGGLSRAHVARLNTNGTVDVTFDPGANGPDGIVWAVTVQPDGKILIGGEFANVGGVTVGGIARLNADGTRDTTFNPGAGTDGFVYAVALQTDGKILVGGDFSSFDSNIRNDLVRLNANGSIDATFDPASSGGDGIVYSIMPTAAGIYVGGAFDSYNGTLRHSLVRLFTDGTVDTGFLDTAYNQFAGLPRARYGDPKGTIYSMGVQTDGKVMIAGSFDRVGGGQASALVRSDSSDPNVWVEPKSRDGVRNRNNIARLLGGETPGPGNISLAATQHTAQENGSSLSVALTRENGTLGYLSANFQVEDGLAQAGVDYVYNAVSPLYLSSWELYLQGCQSSEPGASTRMHSDGLFVENFVPTDIYGHNWYSYTLGNVVLTINNDSVSQGDRNTTFRLSNPTAGDVFFLGGENIPLGGALGFAQAPFTIYDDDKQAGTISFATVNYVVNENVGSAVVTVIRTNGSSGPVSCRYTTLNLTGSATNATQNSDYSPVSGTISFASGQTNRTFTIPIIDDTSVEPDETITIRLFGPVSGGASLGLTNAVVTIIDNDTPGGKLNFSSASFHTNESAGAAVITVTRSGSSAGTLTVYAVATNGTATAGVDFIGVTNVGSSRVDLQACKLEYSIVSPK